MNNAEVFIVSMTALISDVAPIMLFLAVLGVVGVIVDKLAKTRKDLEADEQGAPIFTAYQSWDHNSTTNVQIEHPIVDAFQTNYVKRWWGDE